MARLVLNGKRCLAWQAFIVPGRTYVFPGMGAIVLGGTGSEPAYRAFGDALGGDGGRSHGSHGGIRHGAEMPVSGKRSHQLEAMLFTEGIRYAVRAALTNPNQQHLFIFLFFLLMENDFRKQMV